MANLINTKKPKPSSLQQDASRATAKYRANYAMPKGTQVQHWSKVLCAIKTGMPPDRMNKNLSALQSRNALPATTLLTSKDGKSGTKYTVHESVDRVGESKLAGTNLHPMLCAPNAKAAAGARAKFAAKWDATLSKAKKSFGNEHKFADRYLIPKEQSRMKAANPSINKQDLVEVAGASARWKMTGDPGNVSKHLVERIDLSKGEKPRSQSFNARFGVLSAAKATALQAKAKISGIHKAASKAGISSGPKGAGKPGRAPGGGLH